MPFRFLDLPPELRNRIYDFALYLHGPLIPSVCTHEWPSAAQPALTRVCREVRYEALPVSVYQSFYAVNEFIVHIHGCDFGYFIDWMNAIGPRNRQDVKVVWIHLMDRWSCAQGLIDFVRWYSTSVNTANLDINVEVTVWNLTHAWMMNHAELRALEKDEMLFMRETVIALIGAIVLAKKLRATHNTTEPKLRRALFEWLGEIGLDCSGNRCSIMDSDFDGLCSVANGIARGPSSCCKAKKEDEDEDDENDDAEVVAID